MSKRAFSLVELLVVMAIIAILVGLLFPAVQSVREAARRTECRNQIRQSGLALLNYQSNKHRLPPGWTVDIGDADPGWGWNAYSLPYFDQNNLFKQINPSVSVRDPQHGIQVATNMVNLLCPSSTNDSSTYVLEGVEMGRTHYVGCIGSSAPMVLEDNGDW